MPKVLISDKLSTEAISIFESAGIKVDFKPGISAEELKQIIHNMMVLQFALLRRSQLSYSHWPKT